MASSVITDSSSLYTYPPSLPQNSLYMASYCEENIYLLAKHFLDDAEISSKCDIFVVFVSNVAKTVALWYQKLNDSVVIWDYHVILVLRTKNSANSLRAAETAANRDDDDRTIDEEDGKEIGRRAGWQGGADRTEADVVGDHEGDARKPTPSAGRRFLASKGFVYDFDSRLEMPCAWEEYITLTFQEQERLPEQYRSLLRIVPGDEFVGSFASDRSHMLRTVAADPEFSHDPIVPQDRPDPALEGSGKRYISVPPPYACIVGEKAKLLGVSNNLMSSFVDMKADDDDGGGGRRKGIGQVLSVKEARRELWG